MTRPIRYRSWLVPAATAISSTDPTTVASNDSGSTSNALIQVKGKGGHHHHHRSFGSGQADTQSVLNNITQAFGVDAAEEVTTPEGGIDFSKVAQLLGSKNPAQTSVLVTNPLLNITA